MAAQPTTPGPPGTTWNGTAWVAAPAPGVPATGTQPAPIAGGGSTSTYSATSTSGGGPNAGAIGQTTSTPAGTPAGGATLQSSFRNALLGQLNQNVNNVSLTDPGLAPQMQAFTNAQQRSQERAQQELAEQGFVGGTGRTGAYGAELGAMEQQRGESEAQYGAGLLANERQQRLESLFNAMGISSEQLTADESLRLQRELGLGDLDIRRLDTANDYKLGQGQLGLGLLQAMLQNQQSENRLGFDIGSFGANFGLNSSLPFIK